MSRMRFLSVAGALAVAMGAAGAASAYVIVDGSFESPNVGGNAIYRPIVSQSSFSGNSGVDGGEFGFATAVDGVQAGFLQSGAGAAEIDLSVHGLTVGDTYSLSYYDTQRSGYGILPYTVSINGAQIYSGSPAQTSYTEVTTGTFVAGGTDATLTFFAPDIGGDSDTAIDAIVVNGDGSPTTYGSSAVPEPANWALMLVGFGAAGAAVRSRRKAIVA